MSTSEAANTNGESTQIQEFKCQVPKEILAQMTIYNSPLKGTSVLELSKKYKVMVVLLRHLGCVFCRYACIQIASIYKSLLQCGTIPVFVHAEPKKQADAHFSNYEAFQPYQPLMYNIFRVEDPSGALFYESFGVKSLPKSVFAEIPAILKKKAKMGKETGVTQSNPLNKYSLREMAFYIVEKEAVRNAYHLSNLLEDVDYEKLVMDPEQLTCMSEVSCSIPYSKLQEETGVFLDFVDIIVKEDEAKRLSKHRWFRSSEADLVDEIAPDYSQTFTLQEVMANSDMRRYFKLYGMKEHSIENILCAEQLSAFSDLDNQEERCATANYILDTYLAGSSFMQINIGADVKNKYTDVIRKSATFEPNTFQSLMLHLEATNLADTYSRFTRHPLYAEMIEFCHKNSNTTK